VIRAELFSRSGLSIDRLRSFLVVVESGGIARAAHRDPVRQSQLSRQIAELEAFFGVALVERQGRGVAPTPAGERLATVVRETLQGLHDVAAIGTAEPVLAVSLGAGDSVLHGWVIPRVGRALARAGRTTMSLFALSGPDVAARILDARLDFGIVRANDVPSRVRSRAIGSIAYALYIPKVLRSLRRGSKVSHLLASLPLAMQHGDPALEERLARALAGVTVVPSLVCETFPQAQRAVMTGRFAAVLPTLARAELAPSAFDEIRDPIFGPPMKVHLVWHARLERQRPRAFALVAPLTAALSLG
jgi:LysR family transcriptional regulator, nitrogen assimilation regulatory protein